jgi:hypothetical protein
MMSAIPANLSATARRKNRRLGWALAVLAILYVSAVIAFIVAY